MSLLTLVLIGPGRSTATAGNLRPDRRRDRAEGEVGAFQDEAEGPQGNGSGSA